MDESSKQASFFRQSSWLMIATCAGSVFMVLVHTVARKMSAAEYSDFFTLLKLLTFFCIPGLALQIIFAQQAAAAVTEEKKCTLAITMKIILQVLLLLWTGVSLIVWVDLKPLSVLLKIHNPIALLLTVTLGIPGCWGPVFKGVLQGMHRFNGMGILQAIEGPARFVAMIVVVFLWHGYAVGGLIAVGFGQLSVVALGIWMTRDLLALPKANFCWQKWWSLGIPIIVGLITLNLMYSIDLLFVKMVFKNENDQSWYQGATLIGFAIAQFMNPVMAVMFPRIVRSAIVGEKTNTLFLAIAATAFFGILAGIGCTLLPELPLRIIYMNSPDMWKGAPLVPWFAWALLPLLLANVLLQNSIARQNYRALPYLMAVPAFYALALWGQKSVLVNLPTMVAFKLITQTLGIFNFLFLIILVCFSLNLLKTHPELTSHYEAGRTGLN